MEPDIAQPERLDQRLTGSDRTPCQVKTDKFAGRQLESHADQVGADSAT